MAIRKQLIKMNHVEAVFKVINDADISGSVTIGLTTDLLRSDETLTGGSMIPKVAIRCMEWSVEDGVGQITISRNGVVTQRMHSSTSIIQPYGADREGEQYDIVVTMTGGTLIMHLIKEQGYSANFRPEQGEVNDLP